MFSFFGIFIIFQASKIFGFCRICNIFKIFRIFSIFRIFQTFQVFEDFILLLELIKHQKVLTLFLSLLDFLLFCSSSFNFTSGPGITLLWLVVCKTWFYLFLKNIQGY